MTRSLRISRALARRSGHTLLEVILALGLASLLVAALWVAIDLQLRVTDTTRTNLEQAQLARAILRKISDDLRSAVRYEPVDVASLVSMPNAEDAASSLLASATGTGTGETGGTGGTGGTETETPPSTETSSETPAETPADAIAPKAIPGIYGDRYGLQIDVSRLPRLDQYEAFAAQGAIRDKTSDVKSVAYYLGESGPTSSTSATNVSSTSGGGGLVRRELDRAVTSWAAENGNLSGLDSSGEMLAPEVVALEFRYFDGTEWLDSWDSTASEGLPLAVDVSLAIRSPGSSAEEPWTGARTVSELDEASKGGVFIYRLVVHLPAARLPDPEAAAGTTEEQPETQPAPTTESGSSGSSKSDSSGSSKSGSGSSKSGSGSTKSGSGSSNTNIGTTVTPPAGGTGTGTTNP